MYHLPLAGIPTGWYDKRMIDRGCRKGQWRLAKRWLMYRVGPSLADTVDAYRSEGGELGATFATDSDQEG